MTSALPVVTVDYIKRFLFPASRAASPFPQNPRPPLMNPLREEQALQRTERLEL